MGGNLETRGSKESSRSQLTTRESRCPREIVRPNLSKPASSSHDQTHSSTRENHILRIIPNSWQGQETSSGPSGTDDRPQRVMGEGRSSSQPLSFLLNMSVFQPLGTRDKFVESEGTRTFLPLDFVNPTNGRQ